MYHASQIFVIHESHEDDDERCFVSPASEPDHTSQVLTSAFWLLVTSIIAENTCAA